MLLRKLPIRQEVLVFIAGLLKYQMPKQQNNEQHKTTLNTCTTKQQSSGRHQHSQLSFVSLQQFGMFILVWNLLFISNH